MSNNKELIKSPFEVYPLSEEEKDLITKTQIRGFYDADNYCRIGPNKYVVRKSYVKYKDEIYNFNGENTVWVNSYMRSGTTLTTEMVWQICNNMDFEWAAQSPIIERVPFFEWAMEHSHKKEQFLRQYANDPVKSRITENVFSFEWEKKVPGTRFLKCHIPLSLLPPDILQKGKVVYIARNPKDVMVSMYHFFKMHGVAPPTFDMLWEIMEKDLSWYMPYFGHVTEAWNKRNDKNMFFMFYEDFIKDIKGTIIKLCNFFEKSYTNEQIDKLVDHMKIENFKNNPSVNRDYFDFIPPKEEKFVRRGKADSHKDELFSKELSERADKWIQEQYKKTDLRFPGIPQRF